MSRRKKIGREERFTLNAACSAVVSRRVLPKLKDPSKIGGVNFGKTLCNLGASINLMPLSIYRKLGLGDLRETSDVLVRVKQFILLIGFINLDFKEELEILILLGRPFLATSKATIDVGK
ncbi:Retrovirus-related Pol polyprotein from transposon opus [Gossypium australe]|uniref:Retrovirus-related Pol polyprotein from transposon opus n=1 Tax=Gossypium australe TaxID=47621 RepID=A0A5B6V959_9ROSI|nr:Retrovirus-related Pol polyprotein from transposon opus [Gossypium australe]